MNSNTLRNIAFWALLFAAFIFVAKKLTGGPEPKEFSPVQLMALGQQKDGDGNSVVVRATDHGGIIKGVYKDENDEEQPFRTEYVRGQEREILQWAVANNIVGYKAELGNETVKQVFISILLPIVIIVVLWMVLMRQFQSGSSKAMSFGKSRAKLVTEGQIKITFDDVAGIDEVKEETSEVVEFLKDPKKFSRLGGKIPKGALLYGPPGTGKTLIARAVAGEASVPFFSISGSDFVEMFVGVGASRVRDLFEQGKKARPCLIFIDEIDAVGRHRFAGVGGGHDEREQTLNQLLVELDGFAPNEGVIVMAATNRPDVLDPALLRPGRFDRQIQVDLPDLVGREKILEVHTRKIKLGEVINLRDIARGTPGFSGADLENLANEAALLAARTGKAAVEMSDLEDAKDRVMMGPERRSLAMSEKERKNTAYHEAGHALVAKLLPDSTEKVHKVTIIPRGRALGVTWILPEEDQHNRARSDLLNTLTYVMGGRAAESIWFGEFTTGASNDLLRATELAHKMVCEYGMSERLGPRTFAEGSSGQVFLGRDMMRERNYSEETAGLIDAEVHALLSSSYEHACEIISGSKDALERISESLLDRETLDSDELDALIRGEELPPLFREPPAPEPEPTPDEDAAPEQADAGDEAAPPLMPPTEQPS